METIYKKLCLTPFIKIKTTQDNSTVDVEPKPLFYVDNTPNTDYSPPIYDIDTEATPNEIMPQVRNIRIRGPISFTNKENQATVEPIFAPDLSSTRLNNATEENDHILVDHNVSMPLITVSIDSSCETGASRKITVDRASPKPSPKPAQTKPPKSTVTATNTSPSKPPKLTVTATNTNDNSANNNDKSSKNKNTPIGSPRARKRKADSSLVVNDEPPQKKNASDVIVLDDTILDVDQDDDDSVIFVSSVPARPNSQKAANFISINSNSNNDQSVSIINSNLDRLEHSCT